jgi:hypothetical protein
MEGTVMKAQQCLTFLLLSPMLSAIKYLGAAMETQQ